MQKINRSWWLTGWRRKNQQLVNDKSKVFSLRTLRLLDLWGQTWQLLHMGKAPGRFSIPHSPLCPGWTFQGQPQGRHIFNHYDRCVCVCLWVCLSVCLLLTSSGWRIGVPLNILWGTGQPHPQQKIIPLKIWIVPRLWSPSFCESDHWVHRKLKSSQFHPDPCNVNWHSS